MRRLYEWVLHWADTPYGTPALATISFAESSFFPVPPDPLLMALAIGRPRRSMVFSAVCTVASVLGGLLGYWIGFAAMETIGQPILEFYGKVDTFERLSGTFRDVGFLAVLLAALTPIPYKVFTIAAGACTMPLGTFVGASVLGRGLRFFLLGLLILVAGDRIKSLIDRYFNLAVTLFAVLLVGGFVLVKVFFS